MEKARKASRPCLLGNKNGNTRGHAWKKSPTAQLGGGFPGPGSLAGPYLGPAQAARALQANPENAPPLEVSPRGATGRAQHGGELKPRKLWQRDLVKKLHCGILFL